VDIQLTEEQELLRAAFSVVTDQYDFDAPPQIVRDRRRLEPEALESVCRTRLCAAPFQESSAPWRRSAGDHDRRQIRPQPGGQPFSRLWFSGGPDEDGFPAQREDICQIMAGNRFGRWLGEDFAPRLWNSHDGAASG